MANKHLWSTKIADNTIDAREQLGILRSEWSSTDACFKTYRYMRAASDTTVANGTCLSFSDTIKQVATSDISDADINQVAGVGIGTITADYYGWIQTGGYHSALATDAGDDIADGDHLILHASTNGTCDRTASGSAIISVALGVAVADDVNDDDTVAAWLTLNEL